MVENNDLESTLGTTYNQTHYLECLPNGLGVFVSEPRIVRHLRVANRRSLRKIDLTRLIEHEKARDCVVV